MQLRLHIAEQVAQEQQQQQQQAIHEPPPPVAAYSAVDWKEEFATYLIAEALETERGSRRYDLLI